MPRFELNLRLLELDTELDALKHFLGFIEPQIRALQKAEHERMEAELSSTGPGEDGEFLQLLWQERDYITEHVLPRFFRGPFLVATWAAYENTVEKVSEFLAAEKGVDISLGDLKGDFPNRARKYFQSVLGVALDEDKDRLKRVLALYWLRNFLAHRNGNAYGLSKGHRSALEALLKTHPGLSMDQQDCLILSESFLAEASQTLRDSAGSLIDRARGGPAVRMIAPEA